MEHFGDALPFVLFGVGELAGEGLELFGAMFSLGGSADDLIFEVVVEFIEGVLGAFEFGDVGDGESALSDVALRIEDGRHADESPEAAAAGAVELEFEFLFGVGA